MNTDDIERRLRSPHPLERTYAAHRGRRGRRPVVESSFLARSGTLAAPLVLVVAGLAVVLRLTASSGLGAASQPSTGTASAEPTKPIVSFAPESAPPAVGVAACGGGSVAASWAGSGGAMGTQYALIRIVPLHGSCSLPVAPAVTLDDGAGSTLATSSPPAEPGRIALETAVNARIAVPSICASSSSGFVIAVDLGTDNVVRVQVPPEFSPGCNGGSSQVYVDGLFAVP